MNLFFNQTENRLRAGWRLLLQFVMMGLMGVGLLLILYNITPISGRLWPTLCSAVGAVGSILIAARYLDHRRLAAYGLTFDAQTARDLGVGFSIAAGVMALIFGAEYLFGQLEVIGWGWQMSSRGLSFWARLALFFGFMVLVGFYEELLSRGYQIVNLSEGLNTTQIDRKYAVLGSVALSSLVFGLMHAANPGASWLSTLNVAVAGGMLAFPFIITGRLSFSIGLHIGWNFFQGGVFGFPVSGLMARRSVINIHQNGMPLFTGGHFGPEAGLIGLAGMLLIVMIFICYFKRVGQPLHIHPGLGEYEGPASQTANNLPEQSL